MNANRLHIGSGVATLVLLLVSVAGIAAPDLELGDIHGRKHTPLKAAGQKATAFIFIIHDCPIANGFAPEINRIIADYAGKPVAFYLVYVERDLAPETARQHAKDFGLTATALLDPAHVLVKRAGATVTPEAVVLAPDGTVLYRGRIDDRFADYGKRRAAPTTRDLRDALDAVLAGKPVATPFTKAVGCFIPDVPAAKN